MKLCSGCGEKKELSAFSKKNSAADGLQPQCKACDSARLREVRETRPAEVAARKKESRNKNPQPYRESWAKWKTNPENQRKVRDYNLRVRYGLSLEEFEARVAAQGGLCTVASCGNPAEVVDHCHSSGKVRGVICKKCNWALGYAGDSVARLQGLINYLQESK